MPTKSTLQKQALAKLAEKLGASQGKLAGIKMGILAAQILGQVRKDNEKKTL